LVINGLYGFEYNSYSVERKFCWDKTDQKVDGRLFIFDMLINLCDTCFFIEMIE
jgi:hypothetical protein